MKIGGTVLKRIGIYFFCVVALGCVTSGILYQKSEMNDEIRLEKTVHEERTEIGSQGVSETSEEVMEVSDTIGEEQRFLVIAEEGYLVIYDRVSMTRYDETTILMHHLPENLQEKITEGLYFKNEEALYAFLENYSS